MEEIIAKLNKAFDSRVRLCIMSILISNDRVDFNSFKRVLSLTDGNLASHIKALEKYEFVKTHKKFIGRKPNTTYSVTEYGKREFAEHLKALNSLIEFQQKIDIKEVKE